MPRPEKKRHIRCNPSSYYFKPRGIQINELEEIELAADELEAIRLADLEELFQEDAATKMKISRATFGRIVMRAHHKIADAIINGKAIKIQQDFPQTIKEKMNTACSNCGKKYHKTNNDKFCNQCLTINKE